VNGCFLCDVSQRYKTIFEQGIRSIYCSIITKTYNMTRNDMIAYAEVSFGVYDQNAILKGFALSCRDVCNPTGIVSSVEIAAMLPGSV
jgi:hypothetical protein